MENETIYCVMFESLGIKYLPYFHTLYVHSSLLGAVICQTTCLVQDVKRPQSLPGVIAVLLVNFPLWVVKH